MPICVMVDLFSVAPSIHRTPTLFVFKSVSDNLMSSLMDLGWNTKISMGDDVIKCVVDQQTVVFKYHIGHSTLYSNFQFNRERLFHGSVWEMINQCGPIDLIKIICEYKDWQGEVEVGRDWTLSNIREEIAVVLRPDTPIDFTLFIIHEGHPSQMVNATST